MICLYFSMLIRSLFLAFQLTLAKAEVNLVKAVEDLSKEKRRRSRRMKWGTKSTKPSDKTTATMAWELIIISSSLGYNLQCDLKQLSHSYDESECFKHYEMLLDIQNVFEECRGGISGLAKKILDASLNKTIWNSNWEQRPLTPSQMEYAALDASVLVHLFSHAQDQHQPPDFNGKEAQIEWKSHIVSHKDNNPEKPKWKKKSNSKMED